MKSHQHFRVSQPSRALPLAVSFVLVVAIFAGLIVSAATGVGIIGWE